MKMRTIFLVFLLFSSIVLGAQEQQTIKHKVRWMETLYSIARKYKVNPKDIAVLNDLRTGEISRGQILVIPLPDNKVKEQKEVTLQDTLPAEAEPEMDDRGKSPCRDYTRPYDWEPVVSVILPFPETKTVSGFVDFYQGTLLAAEKMKKKGLSVLFQVYDWNEQPMDDLLSGSSLSKSNLVIGPVYSNQIGSTLAYFRNSNTKIVSPLDNNAEVWTSLFPNYFQVQPTLAAQQESLIRYLDPHNATLWVISEEGEETVAPGIRAILDKNLIGYRNFSYDVLQGREVTEVLRGLLGANPKNQIIIASMNEAFVSDAIRNLHLLLAYNNIPVELFGLSRWRSFETLDLTALHQLQVVLPLSAYVDYSDQAVKEFVEAYRTLFHAEPSQFAFQGYDVALFFLDALFQYGPSFEDCIENVRVPLLQNEFTFVRSVPEGGYSNTGTRVVRYLPDFTVELLP
ncbi:MAG TPA: LysM peptidoglycan-binding domain-containing protein [Bacteroidales bacterium]|nr:MAG: LysM domain protein [Bacteroidetes bacterium ADurb.Bin139]HOG24701.1 LysM peptidoglycan-binding domain-containing protein [Bacteroidales bacterium]HOR11071.1 LysM peptidoglycan-binding domain-containing protein [Bacteroidales bacterium]HOZ19844.1 LysM peptidoglycan-binding domain-containing protein [Bacteroidales bacterium]HPB77884.1 LysM peptidoglycan-binding domain-containing protein [Bacteroidales bacterium]